jgi:uncharacterized protein YhjY with autotransporter beta-barrel domain
MNIPGRTARHLLAMAVAAVISLPATGAQAQAVPPVQAVIDFKANKDNPTQIPIGSPVGVAVVSYALLVLPSILDVAAVSMWTTSSTSPATTLTDSMSCPVFVGPGTLLGEDSCVWIRLTGRHADQSGTASDAVTTSLGGQKEVAEGWFLGGSLATTNLWSQGTNAVSSTGQAVGGSVALKRTLGPWLFAGALALTTSSIQVKRTADAVLQSTVNSQAGGLRLRGAYDVAFSNWYLRPRLDLDLTHASTPGFQESGPSLFALQVAGSSKTSFAATPTLELGGRIGLGEKTILRPYVAVGATFLPDNTSTVTAGYVGFLSSLGSFQSTVSGPSVLANLEAGLQLYQARGFEMKAEYKLSAADGYLGQTASLRGAWHF